MEVDGEYLYTSKINFKGKRTVGKTKEGINVGKNNRFENIKIKRREKKKREKYTELQKPNVEAGIYSNNKKCD